MYYVTLLPDYAMNSSHYITVQYAKQSLSLLILTVLHYLYYTKPRSLETSAYYTLIFHKTVIPTRITLPPSPFTGLHFPLSQSPPLETFPSYKYNPDTLYSYTPHTHKDSTLHTTTQHNDMPRHTTPPSEALTQPYHTSKITH